MNAYLRAISVAGFILLPSCTETERVCEGIPATGFGKPTALSFSADGSRLYVVSGNGDRRYCDSFLSVLNVGPGESPTLTWEKQVPLPGLPGDLKVSSNPDQLLVPTLLTEGDGIAGKLLVLRPDMSLLQEIPTSRGPFWMAFDKPSADDPRLLLTSLPDQRVDILASKSGAWELEDTIAVGSALFRTGPVNVGAARIPLPERTSIYAVSNRSWLLIVDSAFYAFPPEDKRIARGVLWIYPLDQRDQLFWAFVGLRPRSLAVDETRGIAYVTNLGGSSARGDVSLVDLTPPTDDSRTFFTLDLDPTLSAPQGIVPASGSAPYELLLADEGNTLFVTDLKGPRVYEIDLTAFHASMRETGATTLQQWTGIIAGREENPADYFPAATPHPFAGRGAAFLAYDAASRRLAVSDPSADRVWLYSRADATGLLLE